ncbi:MULTISPECIES: hypothetical protein [Methanothrix]|nr:hypothetical protein [Methanothrix soehngenii]MDY0413089.1 hypothetical protein [Methanothrix soehngenii]
MFNDNPTVDCSLRKGKNDLNLPVNRVRCSIAGSSLTSMIGSPDWNR